MLHAAARTLALIAGFIAVVTTATGEADAGGVELATTSPHPLNGSAALVLSLGSPGSLGSSACSGSRSLPATALGRYYYFPCAPRFDYCKWQRRDPRPPLPPLPPSHVRRAPPPSPDPSSALPHARG